VLSVIPAQTDDRVLIDFRTSDDAGVYQWESGPALVQTVDFFTPIVDDPYTYGEIAAANAVSDIYAMGGRPLTALAIACFPKDLIERETARAIFHGGFDKLREAGVALLGGHTVQDPEVKFGYAITGSIDPARIWSNAGAQPGDVLFLTKPIGTGVIATALKFDRTDARTANAAVESMRTLNRVASEALQKLPVGAVHACTDITGFGLAGHASEMASASGATLCIDTSLIPLFAGVRGLALANQSGGLQSNRQHFGSGVRLASTVGDELATLLFDPQTSGGLLIAAAERRAIEVGNALTAAGIAVHRIGAVTPIDADIRVNMV